MEADCNEMEVMSQYLLKQVGPQTLTIILMLVFSVSQYLLKQVGPQTCPCR